MAALDQPLTAGPPSRKGRWSEYTELSRELKQAGLLERRRGWYAARIVPQPGCCSPSAWVAFVLLGESWWQLLTAAYLAVVFTQIDLRRARRRPPPDLPVPARQRPGRSPPRQPAGRDQLRLVGPQAQPPTTATPTTRTSTPTSASRAWRSPTSRPAPRTGLVRLVARSQAWLFFPLLLLEAAHLHLASLKSIVRGRGRANLVEGLLLLVHARRLPHRPAPGAVAAPGGGVRRGPAGPVRAVPGLLVRPQPQGHADPHRRRPAGLRPASGADLPQRPPAAGWSTSCWAGSTTRSSTTCSRTCPGPTCATPSRWCGRSAAGTACPTSRPAWSVPTSRPCATSTPSAPRSARHRQPPTSVAADHGGSVSSP